MASKRRQQQSQSQSPAHQQQQQSQRSHQHHPLNPFLRAFFHSSNSSTPLAAQCQPIANHVLLVPTTECLLQGRDRDSGVRYVDLLAGAGGGGGGGGMMEEFLASHVLRVTPPLSGEGITTTAAGAGAASSGGKEAGGVGTAGAAAGAAGVNGKEGGGGKQSRIRQYTTLNGRSVIIKDAFVYSNKGFKTLQQAQLIGDTIFYPDVADTQQWLVYYISKPLVGVYYPTLPPPALLSDEPSSERRKLLAEAADVTMSGGSATAVTGAGSVGKKRDIKTFGELLVQFPVIARQMQVDLERLLRDFVAQHEIAVGGNKKQQQQQKRGRSDSQSSQVSLKSLSEISSIRSSRSGISGSTIHPTALELDSEEQTLRTALETAIISAIDLFQSVDKQQLSILGASTDLTGPAIERMIERYVAEYVHDQTIFPRVCGIRKAEDADLDTKIRKMRDVDIAQVGVPIEDGMRGKRLLARRLAKGVDAFWKMSSAGSPQEMLEVLLHTQKVITEDEAASSGQSAASADEESAPSSVLTVNADVLVSLLLVVVIRSGVRHLPSRLVCMRYFIFIDEVEAGEQGYALATLEAVLAHLTTGSAALRKVSKYNRLFWQAVKNGDLATMRKIVQPLGVAEDAATLLVDSTSSEEEDDGDASEEVARTRDAGDEVTRADREIQMQPDLVAAASGSLQHIFPFQRPPTPPPEMAATKVKSTTKKRVSLASLPRSQSVSSAYSSRTHSRNMSIDSSMTIGVGGDLSVEKLTQTQDADGNSVLMMAVEAAQPDALSFLLSMPAHFRLAFVLDDVNNDGTTLLHAAVQSGQHDITEDLLEFLEANATADELNRYYSMQDHQGRCFAHYLFHQPDLIARFGVRIPWRLKDHNGQTPLFALCRSYDHEQYRTMVEQAIVLATRTQGDGQPLHLDDHVDAKGNTLLHIVHDTQVAMTLLHHCDSDINAANDKRFTPLMVASKYGRTDLLRVLFGDARIDVTLRDFRGLTAVELAKDDDIRNRIDDLVLLSTPPGKDGRMTTIVRSMFVEDSSVRMILKSGVPNDNGTITVTTCRRSAADFETLARLLALECPASWLPTHFALPSPYLIASKPSRAVLRDVQIRLDNFFRNLLTHGTFAIHELVWEFFLVPDIDTAHVAERSRLKAEIRVENIKDDYPPVKDTQEVENFVAFARDQVKGVSSATKRVTRCVNRARMQANDLAEAQHLLGSGLSNLLFLPHAHTHAYLRYSRALLPSDAAPLTSLYYALHSIYSTSTAIQVATNRPAYLIGSMNVAQRALERHLAAAARASSSSTSSGVGRWTSRIGLLEDAKRANIADAEEKAAKARGEWHSLACELRYTQQTIAGELAVWQEEHVRAGREMLRTLAADTIVREKARLESFRRALREARGG